jgi:hypothetical protein
MPRRAVAALGLVVTVLLLLGLAPAASAHDYLVSSTPGEGEQVDVPPTEVALSFNTSVGQQFAQVAVVDADGTTYQVGEPLVDGPTVTQQVTALAPGRDYSISYRVVSSDGHPIGGTVGFTVAAAGGDAAAEQPDAAAQDAAAQDAAAAEQQADSTADEPATTSENAGTGAPVATDETAATAAPGGGVSPVVWVVGAGVLALLGALGVGLTRRRSTTGS